MLGRVGWPPGRPKASLETWGYYASDEDGSVSSLSFAYKLLTKIKINSFFLLLSDTLDLLAHQSWGSFINACPPSPLTSTISGLFGPPCFLFLFLFVCLFVKEEEETLRLV